MLNVNGNSKLNIPFIKIHLDSCVPLQSSSSIFINLTLIIQKKVQVGVFKKYISTKQINIVAFN